MVTRRDHRRQQTIDEIKDTARDQIAGAGPAGISMRAIARHLAMTASAVHYYFPSHQALLDALVADGFTAGGEALRIAYVGLGRRLRGERWLAVCRAHRAWALDYQAEYLLLYGYDGACAVQQRDSQVDHAFSQVVNVLYSIMREAVAAGEIDTERIEAATSASLRRQLATWRDQKDQRADLPDGALAACMIAYAQLHGAITLELLGHVPPPLADHGALFELEMTHAYTALCRPPHT